MTSEELRERKRELMARKKYELELQGQGKGDNFALFMVNEELLDVNAQLRALAPAGKGIKYGRKGRTVHSDYGARVNAGDRQQFVDWTRQDREDAAAGARAELKRMLPSVMDSLTKRQREIILLYADGLSMRKIAHRIGVNVSTISRTISWSAKKASRILVLRRGVEKLGDRDCLDLSDAEARRLLLSILSPHQTVYFYLRFVTQLTTQQIGSLLGVNQSTVSRTVNRALKRINHTLGGAVDQLGNVGSLGADVLSICRVCTKPCNQPPKIGLMYEILSKVPAKGYQFFLSEEPKC